MTIIRTANVDDYPSIAEIHNSQTDPDHHLTADRLARHDRASLDGDPVFRRFVAVADGAVTGTGTIRSIWSGPARPGRLWVELLADSGNRGEASAGALLRHLLRAAPEDRDEVLTVTREDVRHAAAFVELHGFEEVFRSWGAHLDPRSVDVKRFAPLFARALRSDIAIVHYQDLDEDSVRQLATLQRAIEDDVTAFPPIVPQRHDAIPDSSTVEGSTFVAVTATGRCVGFTHLVEGGAPDHLAFGLTGVARSHRRQGIATALKGRAVGLAAELGCVDLNAGGGGALDAPIVRANRRLGYAIEPAWITLRRRL